MKRTLLFLFVAVCTASNFAQNLSNPDLEAMVNTERAFAKMAKEQNRRDAFLYYLSDDVVTSGPNGPVKGKKSIKKQTVKADWLSWEVAFSDIASSGDFGYDTGPWEYRKNKTDEKPVAYGEFNSIWKKQSDGSWRNVLDFGVEHGEPTDHNKPATSAIELKPDKKVIPSKDGNQELIKAEEKFIERSLKDNLQAYAQFLSTEARFCHSGSAPVVTREARQKFLKENLPAVTFHLIDGEAASSNDLGYVYGTAGVKLTHEGKTKIKKASYAHFWKKENGSWKIVLEVLSY